MAATDIAALGISIDSSQTDKGTVSLTKLSTAARQAEAATKGTAAGARSASAAAAAVADKSNSAAAALNAEAKAARNAAEAAHQHAAANSNQKYQWESGEEVAQRLGLRMKEVSSATEAATDALNSQSTAAENAGGSAGEAAANIDKLGQSTETAAVKAGLLRTVLTTLLSVLQRFLLSALSVAVGVLIAELGKLVDWAGLAKSALNMLADAVEAVAPYVVAAAAALALLYAPAIIAGIGAVAVALGGLAVTAVRAAASFTAAWLAAIGPVGWFVLGLAAVIAAAVIFRDKLTQIFGFDIVEAAKSGINTIIAVFHGGYDGIKASWSLLPAAIGDLVYQAANATISGVEKMLNFVIEKVDAFIGKIEGVISTVSGWIGQDGVELGRIGEVKFGRPTNPYAGAAAKVGETIKGAISGHMGTDYLGDLGSTISSGASAAADKLRGLAGSFGAVEEAAGGAGKAATDAANGAKDPWKGLRSAVDKTKEAMSFARDIAGGFVSDLRSGLKQGEGFWTSFKNAALNALDKITDKLLNEVLDALFQVKSAGSGMGGSGSLFGSILGGIGSLFGFSQGGYTGHGAATQAAGIVHAGEYVFSKGAVDRIGLGYLDSLHSAAKGYMNGGYVRFHAPANTNMRGYQTGGQVQPAPQYGNTATAQRVDVYVHSDDEKLRVFVQQEADGRILEATPQIVGAAVSRSTKTVVPTMAAYQQQKAGGNYRG